MAHKITKSFVVNTPYPDGGQIFYRNTELKGFGLLAGTGSKVYIAEGKVDNKTVRVTVGHHGVFAPEQAHMEARSILGMIAHGLIPIMQTKRKKRAA